MVSATTCFAIDAIRFFGPSSTATPQWLVTQTQSKGEVLLLVCERRRRMYSADDGIEQYYLRLPAGAQHTGAVFGGASRIHEAELGRAKHTTNETYIVLCAVMLPLTQ